MEFGQNDNYIQRFGAIKDKKSAVFNEKFLFIGNNKKYKITIDGKKATIFPDFPVGIKIKIEGNKELLKIKELKELKKIGKIIFLNELKPHKGIEGKTKTKVNGILNKNNNIGIIGEIDHPEDSKTVGLQTRANKLGSEIAFPFGPNIPKKVIESMKKHLKKEGKDGIIYI